MMPTATNGAGLPPGFGKISQEKSMAYQQQGKRNTKKKEKKKPQPQYMKRLSSWLLASQLETLYRYVRWFNRQGVVFFTEALITCGDKTACDTQLSRSRRLHRRLAKKRSGDLHMGEVAEHNDKEVGGGATRRRDPNTSSKRSPLRSERLIGSRSLRRNIHCLFRHVRLRARRRETKQKGGAVFFQGGR